MNRFGFKDLFRPSGRLNRMDFFSGGALLAIAAVCIGFALSTLLGFMSGLSTIIVIIIQVLVTAPLLYGQFCVAAKRLHDLGLPAVLSVIGFVELAFTLYIAFSPPSSLPAAIAANVSHIDNVLKGIVIVFNLLLLFVPGTQGENRYGRRTTGGRPQAHNLEG